MIYYIPISYSINGIILLTQYPLIELFKNRQYMVLTILGSLFMLSPISIPILIGITF